MTIENRSLVTTGPRRYGGDSSAVQAQLVKVQQLAASYAAFAALKSDGTVVVWGDADYGGHVPEEVQSQLKEIRRRRQREIRRRRISEDGGGVDGGVFFLLEHTQDMLPSMLEYKWNWTGFSRNKVL